MQINNTLSVSKILNHSKFTLKVLDEQSNQVQNNTNSTVLPNYNQINRSKIAFLGRKEQSSDNIDAYENAITLVKQTLIKPLASSNEESIPPSVLLGFKDAVLEKSIIKSIKENANADFVTISEPGDNVISELDNTLTEARHNYLKNGKRTVVIINDAEKILGMSSVYAKDYSDISINKQDLKYLDTLGNNTRNINYFKSLLDHVHEVPKNQNDYGKSATTILMTSKKPHLIHTDLTSRNGKVKTIIFAMEKLDPILQEELKMFQSELKIGKNKSNSFYTSANQPELEQGYARYPIFTHSMAFDRNIKANFQYEVYTIDKSLPSYRNIYNKALMDYRRGDISTANRLFNESLTAFKDEKGEGSILQLGHIADILKILFDNNNYATKNLVLEFMQESLRIAKLHYEPSDIIITTIKEAIKREQFRR